VIPEIVLGVAFLAVLVFHFLSAHQWAEERRFLLNRETANTSGELVMLQRGTAPEGPLTAEIKDRKLPVKMQPLGL
jgi:hypothetical protein